MAFLLISFICSFLASTSYTWPIQSTATIELIAYGDNTQTLTAYGPFGTRSSYWPNIWKEVRTDLGSSYTSPSEWPIVENSQNTLAIHVTSGAMPWQSSKEDLYKNASARLNNWDPDTVQQYMRRFINASLMFQIKDASAPTQGLLGDPYTFNLDTCIADDPPKIWLTTKCQMNSGSVEIWSCADAICDWRSVWKQYIFPSADLIDSITGMGVHHWKVDIQFDFAYSSYCDLHSDIVYNGGEITAEAMEATLIANFPPISSGNVTEISLDCDLVALTCTNSNYCTWTLPWLHFCNYTADACDTTTTTLAPTKAPITTTTTGNPTGSTTKAPTSNTLNPSHSTTLLSTYDTNIVSGVLDETMVAKSGADNDGNNNTLIVVIIVAAIVLVLVVVIIVIYRLCKKKYGEKESDATAKVENAELVQRTVQLRQSDDGGLTNIVQVEEVDFNTTGY